MNVTYMMGLLGGLALFLYGMQMMSAGLESAAGNRMKSILEKLTANRFTGVLAGALITAIIQSSSATTVMVVGFVNSGMMTLNQAIWIIMGANIGTTITGQLIALDVGAIAPLLAFLGVAAIVFLKNERIKHTGEILAGLGILFIGMDMMGEAMKPLAASEDFVSILTNFENPLLGIAAGTIFTALIQSSSASVGILQTLADSGAIGLGSAAFVLFGQNIGTCITALLASIGTNVNARRTTLIHIMFNVFGTAVFTVLCLASPIIPVVESWTPGNAPAQIANLHTMFNVVTTLLLLPVGTWLGKIAMMILKDQKGGQTGDGMRVQYLLDLKHIRTEKLGASMVCVEGIKKELFRMMDMAGENVQDAFDTVEKRSREMLDQVLCREEYVDFLNKEISKYITSAVSFETTTSGSRIFNALFSIAGNVERISDHAVNIAGYAKMLSEKHITFSRQAQNELTEMKEICQRLFVLLQETPANYREWHSTVACMEQQMDDMTVQFRNHMYARIQDGACSDEGSVLFSEMLTDFERIGDHSLNIADEVLNMVERI
ncbi:Na/Pi cotransporter family protein [Parablautia sp. Marseille-Q6255]|uniref:Na/Pi cotransporter family protein n=1 Tax=Parablautia sp. Marseille-Q6255 TaxID=3039593 RepID=UPI0024BC9850|nr:Na/Pi cotransporter family protein [Parablautia sp. Marseille-Q6255]